MFPSHWTHETLCERALAEILINQQKQIFLQEENLAKLSDVQASITKLKADVVAFIAANSGGASDADLDVLKASVDAVDDLVAPQAPPDAPTS